METINDKNGNTIKIGDELEVPLDVFSNGIVILDKNGKLALELRFEGKSVPVSGLNSTISILKSNV